MVTTREIRQALANVRSRQGVITEQNRLRPGVIESWLAAAEEELKKVPRDRVSKSSWELRS
jgi:hypothetical protein